MPKKRKATSTRKHAGGRPKLTAAAVLLNPQYIRALAAYTEARDKGDGHDAAIEAAATAGRCGVNTVKKLVWNFQVSRREFRRLLKAQGHTDAEIDAQVASLDERGGLYRFTWRRGAQGFDLTYAPTQPYPRKKYSRIRT